MISRILILLFATQFVFFASCEKVYIPPEQEAAKKITVNCLFDNYGVVRVYLTESVSGLSSNDFVPLPDASVELFEEGIFKELMQYIPSDSLNTFGSFQSSFIPSFGKRYMLNINQPVYGASIAEDVMPHLVPIDSAKLITKGIAAQDADAIVEISFDDDVNVENFYRLNVWLWQMEKVYDMGTGDSVEQVTFRGVRVTTEEAVTDSVRDNDWALLFSDKNFNGQHRTLRLHFKAIRYSRYEQVNLHIDLNNVSKNHYEYFRTLELYRESDNDEDQPDVSSNIQNGYGIFAGSAVSTVVIGIK